MKKLLATLVLLVAAGSASAGQWECSDYWGTGYCISPFKSNNEAGAYYNGDYHGTTIYDSYTVEVDSGWEVAGFITESRYGSNMLYEAWDDAGGYAGKALTKHAAAWTLLPPSPVGALN